MNKRVLGVVLAISALYAYSAECQQRNNLQGDDLAGFLQFAELAGTGTLDRGVQGLEDAVEINASTDSSNATIKVARSVSEGSLFTTFTVTASAPIDKNSNRTELANLDGLRNAFTLGGKYTWFMMRGKRNPSNDQRVFDLCDEMVAAFKSKTGKTDADAPGCDTNNVKTFLPEKYVEYRSLFFAEDAWMASWGIEPKVGYKQFSFLESETLEKKMSDSKVPWSVEAFFGFTPKKSQTLITIGGNYQEGFKDAESGTLCPTSGAGSTVACKTGPVGEPVKDDAELGYLEFRRRLLWAGVSLKITYDFKENLAGVDLPITFIKDKDGSLTGGIRVGWTEADHWQVGIFAGKAFNLF